MDHAGKVYTWCVMAERDDFDDLQSEIEKMLYP
jgi:hypothetical protein